jgi:phosphotransferase system HPr (HPr) family protein
MQGSSEAGEASGRVTLPPDVALHARPAADFVRTAIGFDSRIEIAAGERTADAKSLMAVLALGAKGGTELRLRAEGNDAPRALEALLGCVAGFA